VQGSLKGRIGKELPALLGFPPKVKDVKKKRKVSRSVEKQWPSADDTEELTRGLHQKKSKKKKLVFP